MQYIYIESQRKIEELESTHRKLSEYEQRINEMEGFGEYQSPFGRKTSMREYTSEDIHGVKRRLVKQKIKLTPRMEHSKSEIITAPHGQPVSGVFGGRQGSWNIVMEKYKAGILSLRKEKVTLEDQVMELKIDLSSLDLSKSKIIDDKNQTIHTLENDLNGLKEDKATEIEKASHDKLEMSIKLLNIEEERKILRGKVKSLSETVKLKENEVLDLTNKLETHERIEKYNGRNLNAEGLNTIEIDQIKEDHEMKVSNLSKDLDDMKNYIKKKEKHNEKHINLLNDMVITLREKETQKLSSDPKTNDLSLTICVREKEDKIEKLESEHMALRKEITELKEAAETEEQKQLAIIEDYSKKSMISNSQIQALFADKDAFILNYQTQVADQDKKIKDMEKKLNEARFTQNIHSEEHFKLYKTKKGEEIEHRNREICSLKLEISKMESKFLEIEEQIEEIGANHIQKLGLANELNNKLQTEIAELNKNIDNITQYNDKKEKHLAIQLNTIQQNVTEKEKEIEGTRNQIENQKLELIQKEKIIQENKTKIYEWENSKFQVKEMEIKIADIGKNYTEQLNKKVSENEKQKEQINIIDMKHERLEAICKEKEITIKQYEKAQNKLSEENKEIEKQINQFKMELDKEKEMQIELEKEKLKSGEIQIELSKQMDEKLLEIIDLKERIKKQEDSTKRANLAKDNNFKELNNLIEEQKRTISDFKQQQIKVNIYIY